MLSRGSEVRAGAPGTGRTRGGRQGEARLPQAEKQPTVVVADGDWASGFMIGETLSGAGMVVTVCADGAELLEAAPGAGAVVVALPLPDITTAEVLPRLRARCGWATAVIATGASASAEVQVAAYEAGADVYLPMPLNPALLRAVVRAQTARAGRLVTAA